MKEKVLSLLLALPLVAFAGGFVDEPTCYSWEGGHKSAGSFSKCTPAWVLPPEKPPVVAVAVTAPVAAPVVVHQSPIMMPQSHPAPKPVVKKKHKPKPKKKLKCICEVLPPK